MFSMCTYVAYVILDCSRSVVRDIVFVVDTNYRISYSTFQLVRELIESITINIAVDSPKTLFGLITFDDIARLEFNITRHTNLDTLLPAINPGLVRYYGFTSNTDSALSLLLTGSVEGGSLQLRNNTSKVAIVVTSGYNFSSLQSAANSLHAANVFDVYAVGISNRIYSQLQLIASDPSFVFSTSSLTNFTAQQLEIDVIERLCSSE